MWYRMGIATVEKKLENEEFLEVELLLLILHPCFIESHDLKMAC